MAQDKAFCKCILVLVLIHFMALGGTLSSPLDPVEISALKDIRSSLQDLPGSFFFFTWNFNLDPCFGFHGVVCWPFGGTSHVTMLSLGSGLAGAPGLSGQLHPSIGKLKYLKMLTLVPGAVRGKLPDSIGELRDLQFIGISKNKLTGSIPSCISNLVNLEGLDLSFNILTGSIPSGLGSLPRLNTLTLAHNSLSGSLPRITSPLIHLDLQKNALSGDLPALPYTLEYLSLARNSFSGSLGPVSGLNSLTFLDLSFNEFTGSIPSAIFGFKLTDLLLQRNKLSGPVIPPGPVSIVNIDLSYNTLSGQPSPLLSYAQKLFLNNNRFTGLVPQEFVDSMVFGDLQILYLQHNYFRTLKMGADLPLPTTCTFCIQYNCLNPPMQSACPTNVGRQSSRPSYQCNSASTEWP